MNISKIKTQFIYSVEMYDCVNKVWKPKEKRFYAKNQNISDFPNNKMRRKFNKL